MSNHVIHVKSYDSGQINHHVQSCHLCHQSCSVVIKCVIIGILYQVERVVGLWASAVGSKSAFTQNDL
jgi:hypothetical protein